jgi:multimeric flavodoxin WrbA
MSKILIINGSPRKEGTSKMFCKICADFLGGDICKLYADIDSVEWLMPKIDEAETIILAGPCYIDTYPAHVIYLLEKIAEHPQICHGQKVYGIINGGMPYVHTHESGIRMLKLFCQDCNMQYQGGFVMGLGPLLDGKPLKNHIYAKKLVPAFDEFLEHIKKGEKSPDKLFYNAEMKIPSIIARFLTYSMNKKIDKNLKQYGFDYKQPSPYWEK